jgi:hypothetical protein
MHELRQRHCLIIGLSSRGTQESMGAIGQRLFAAGSLYGFVVPRNWVAGSAGSIETRTDIQHANGFILAQESVVARHGDG